MIVPDVTVLISAARSGAADHDLARRALVDLLTGSEPVGLLDESLTSVVRILTDPRAGTPQPAADVITFCDRVREAPAAVRLTPADTAWPAFTASVRDLPPRRRRAGRVARRGRLVRPRDPRDVRSGLPPVSPGWT